MFNSVNSILKSHNSTLHSKTRLLKCYVAFPVLSHGVETWARPENRMMMMPYTRMTRISYMHEIANADVLQRTKKEAELVNIGKARKLQYLVVSRGMSTGTVLAQVRRQN